MSDSHEIKKIGGHIHWVENGVLHVDRPLFGAEEVLLDRIAELERQLAAMRASFHVNMLSAFPAKSHEEIAAEIDRAIGPTAQPTAQQVKDARERVARAIWNIRREDEDRCDMELEDMGSEHSVWQEADAAIAALQAGKEKEHGN